MTEGGVSKKVVIGLIVADAISDIAVSDDSPENKKYYVVVLAAILVIYLFKQTFLDFTKNVWMVLKQKNGGK
jgi:hypothetical protein